MSALSFILEQKLVAIIRGVAPKDILNVAEALYAGGIRVLEVTLNSEDALNQIERLNKMISDKMLIGAGTVLDVADAKAAVEAGAKFLISPIVDADVIRFAKDQNVVSIPGAYTATEIVQAHKAGADIIKVFPVSDAAYIKALLAPLDKIRLMPTGGINLSNIKQFHDAGAVAFGIGSALVQNTGNMNDAHLNSLTERARSLVQALQSS